MPAPTSATDHAVPHTLAQATLPGRVRQVLEQLLNTAADELERHLTAVLEEFEQQLFRLADHARNPGIESSHLQTLRTLRLNRADLLPQFMAGLEASVAEIGRHTLADRTSTARAPVGFQPMSLVDETEMDEGALLNEIAVRQESRASLTLHLLGQRFGVLAGAPAFDAQHMPFGPQSLCRIMQDAVQSLQLPLEPRLLLYRIFDRKLMAHYPQMLERLNAAVVAGGILPSLTYVPIRLRPRPQATAATATGTASARDRKQDPAPATEPRGDGNVRAVQDEQHRTHTAWLGEADDQAGAMDQGAAFDMLRQLLTGRRELLGKLRPDSVTQVREELGTTELVAALGSLQETTSPTGTSRNLLDIKQTLLAQTRQQRGHGACLSRDDNDTFELLGILYSQIEREVRDDVPAAALLKRLQVPLLRVALQDRAFFVSTEHPARQLLNAVAESGAHWLGDDDVDPQLLQPLKHAVEHVIDNFDGDPAVFEASNQALQTELHALARKAELVERRHVEAARGKEKLEVAKRRAADTIAELVGKQRLPRFVRALLNQAWADVLTLSLLRHGADSPEWKQQLKMTRRIVATCGHPSDAADTELAAHIEAALSQVGYHTDEAGTIAHRLTSAPDDDDDDPASRTELAMKLKARARLGEDASTPGKPDLPPRNGDEQARFEQLQTLPYGTWIEFVTNQQGDIVRRRLSWYSPITGHALFVNQRGQRVAEHTLDSLARMMARDQARVVTSTRGRLVDRAWQATLNALRSFASHGDERSDPAGAVP